MKTLAVLYLSFAISLTIADAHENETISGVIKTLDYLNNKANFYNELAKCRAVFTELEEAIPALRKFYRRFPDETFDLFLSFRHEIARAEDKYHYPSRHFNLWADYIEEIIAKMNAGKQLTWLG